MLQYFTACCADMGLHPPQCKKQPFCQVALTTLVFSLEFNCPYTQTNENIVQNTVYSSTYFTWLINRFLAQNRLLGQRLKKRFCTNNRSIAVLSFGEVGLYMYFCRGLKFNSQLDDIVTPMFTWSDFGGMYTGTLHYSRTYVVKHI